MSATIDYYYSTRSIYAYFGAERIVALARQAGRRLVHKPIDLSRVVPASGSLAFDQRPSSHKHHFFGREIERWSEYLGIPVLTDPVHHFGDRTLSSGWVIAAQQQGADVDRLHIAILRALWQDDRDLSDAQVLSQITHEAGLDPAPLLAVALGAEVQAIFANNTEEAVARGVFGSPTYIVDGEMFYGQDRLMMVERALQQPFKPAGALPNW
jgi:2-hydroxychromene-2-carboxylate isomerase